MSGKNNRKTFVFVVYFVDKYFKQEYNVSQLTKKEYSEKVLKNEEEVWKKKNQLLRTG